MRSKVLEVEDWVYNWRCKQSAPGRPIYFIEFINCYKHTVLFGNSPKDYRRIPQQGAVYYLPFHKNGVDIRIHTCMWDGR